MGFFNRLLSKQLGQLLKEYKIVTEAQLKEALEIQKEKGGMIGEILVSLGYAKEEEIAKALTIQYGFPYLPLENYEIEESVIDLIPAEFAKRCGVITIDKIGTTLTVAMVNPLNVNVFDDLERLTKCTIQTFVTTSSSFKRALRKYYKQKE